MRYSTKNLPSVIASGFDEIDLMKSIQTSFPSNEFPFTEGGVRAGVDNEE
jgi:hypothetical protein